MFQPTIPDTDGIGTIDLSGYQEETKARSGHELHRLEAWLESSTLKAATVRVTNCSISRYGDIVNLFSKAPVPLAAVITGPCLDGLFELVLACHFRFADERAQFGFTGKSSSAALSTSLQNNLCMMGRRRLRDLLTAPGTLDGREAALSKLVDSAVPKSALETGATEFLKLITARRSPSLIRDVLCAIGNSHSMSRESALARESELFYDLAGQGAGDGVGQ